MNAHFENVWFGKKKQLQKNVGNIDRIIRLIVVAAIAVLLFTKTVALTTTLGVILAIAGGIFLFTALSSWCAIYSLIGASTCKLSTN